MVTCTDYHGPDAFVHLHAHSHFSSRDGVPSPQQYAAECAKRGYPAMALTEHGHMASIPDMYWACKKYGIKQIAACEIYHNDWEPKRQELARNGIKLKPLQQENPELYNRIVRNRHLTVLAKNQTGFENLIKLTTQAYSTGLFGMGRSKYNRVWWDKLCEYKDGLIVLSGCLNGAVCHELRVNEIKSKAGDVVWAREPSEGLVASVAYVKKFKEVFGDDFYIELQMPGVENDEAIFRILVAIADKYKIEPIISNDAHYLSRPDFAIQKIMMAIEQNERWDSPNLFHVNSSEQYFKTRAELWERFKNYGYSKGIDDGLFERACDNTLLVADKCLPLKIDDSPKIPNIKHAEAELVKLVHSELAQRGLLSDKRKYQIDGNQVTYAEQAKLELKRIIDKGFASYFLITRELVQYGKSNGHPFSPRGSAGGSLICYLLGISCIDNMKWGLSFDRFLSASRGGYRLDIRME